MARDSRNKTNNAWQMHAQNIPLDG